MLNEKKDMEERGEDFTFATPHMPGANPDTGLHLSTRPGKYCEEKAPRRSPRKTKAKASLEGTQSPFVRHIHVRTTEDLVRQASQEAAELEHLASRRRKSDALNKPKQPKGSFVFFLNEYRARMVKDASLQNKKTNLGQMTKEAGILWRSMDNAKKKPYQNLAAKDRQRYLMEKKEYSMTEELVESKTKELTENPVKAAGISLRSYQEYLQDQINDLQNRLNMFQSRCSQPVQALPQIQPQHLSMPAPQADHLPYMNSAAGQHNIPQYRPMIPTTIFRNSADDERQKPKQERTLSGEVYRGRMIP